MLIRYVRSGSVSGTLEVTDLPSTFMAAVSSADSTSFAQESSGTSSIDVSGFSPLELASLHVLSGSISEESERITGSFVSGNIFGGDKYRYSTQSLFFYGNITQSVVYIEIPLTVMTASVIADVPFQAAVTGDATGGAPAEVPREGQVFPRGTG